MEEIRCPKCGSVIELDENAYSNIATQVRDKEFKKDVSENIKMLEKQKESELDILKLETEQRYKEKIGELEKKISDLNNEIRSSEDKKKLAINEAERSKDDVISKKDAEIIDLKNRISNSETEKKLAISDAVKEKEDTISQQNLKIEKLNSQIQTDSKQHELDMSAAKSEFAIMLDAKDKEVQFYKDFKAKQSTKMIGESLEQYCLNEFNKYRATGFQNAYFEKDNDASSGSKGDFIFRDFTDDGMEYISIMFEMKNEADNTAKKHTNDHFFKELDKDRNEKGCEYAVLVSMLESDSDLYNNGIVDVSHIYDKMYVIRPQFLIPMITLLRNAARNSIEYQRQLAIMENQNIDITNFEERLTTFKDSFENNYNIATKKFSTAIDEIDKAIDHLQKIKDNLLASDRQLRLANDKAQDITIKKLTWNNPTMKEKFNDLKKGE